MTLSTDTKAILLLASNPLGTARLRLDQEVREIEERLSRSKNREQFALNPKWAVRADDLRQALLEVDPQIVHFCGHGAGEEGLAFETETGQVQLVSADALAGLFELFADQVECVLLNACYSEVQATAISQHINYVIGMSQAIEDRTALKFAAGFYDALGAGRSIEVAYKFGCNAIQLEGIPQHLVPVLKRKSAIASTPTAAPPSAVATDRPAIEVFFSYSHKDEEWRDQLAAHLSNLQRQNVIHQWHDRQILPGTEWNGEIDSHLNQANIILLLVSADFLASDYCWDVEVKYAMQRHHAGSARVVPILLRPTDWQGAPFSKLQPLPTDARPITRWPDRDEALLNVAQGLRAVVESFAQPDRSAPAVNTPGTTSRSLSVAEIPPPGPENLPRSGVVSFVGRMPALTELHQALHDSHQPAIVALTGMAGVGKTELALQYARQHLRDYPGGLCWVSARTAQVGTQILDFARLYFNLTPPTTIPLLQQVAFCWQHWPTGQVLLLLDDVTDYQQVEPFLPPLEPRFKVLLTTRRQLGASIRKLTLDALSPELSLALLRSLVGPQRLQAEAAIAEQLCDELGGLPLGLELVGRYLSRKPDLSLARMQQRLAEKGLSDRATRDAEAEMTARLGIQAAFDLSWELLPDEAKILGGVLSLFAAAPIPWTLVERCYPELDPDDLEDLRDDYWMNLHLLQRKQEGIYQLNQLIRRFLQAQYDGAGQREAIGQRFCRAMVALAEQIPEESTRDRVMALRPAMPHLAEAATTLHAYLSDTDLIKPFEGLGRFYTAQGFYDQAEDWYKQCRTTVEQRFGTEHPTVATSLCHLGWVYHLQGRYGEAEPLFVLALALRQRLLGEEHLDVADSLNYLALLYQDQGEYEQAEPLAMRSLAMRQQLLGEEHLDVADSLNNLALLYQDQGRYTEAEALYTQAWSMRQRLMGEDYPRVASSLNNLAYCYASQKRYDEAEALYLQAKAMYQRLLGEEHPDFAISLNNLAQLYDLQERYAEAEPLFAQALAINQRVLGENHPNVATSLNSLGAVYDIQGRHAEAEPLYLQALELRQRLLGADHPLVAISLNNLAKLYVAQKRYREAKPLYPRAVALLEQRLGADHPITVKVRSNLEELQRTTKKRSKSN
ncbi:MAG: tetratricopeptide repeat protein [Leptolyngbya sp. BL-A-14]